MSPSSDPKDLPLGPTEERLLDYSLGRLEGESLQAAGAEAEALRRVVETARGELVRQETPANAVAVAELRAAARSAAEPAAPGSFWRHLQGGLRTSPWIRLAAASLVIHMAALPVLAWLHYTSPPERALFIRFEQPAEALTSEPTPELLEPIKLEELLAPHAVDELQLGGE